MGRPRRNNNQFTWVIKNFSTSQSEIIYSDEFVIGDCNWRLMAYPNGDRIKNFMSLYLDVADSKYLPCGWTRHIKLHLSVVNQVSEELSHRKIKNKWLDRKTSAAGFLTMIPHSKLFDEQGFVVNGQVIVVVKIDVFEVIGKVNIIEVPDARSGEESDTESEEASSPVKKTKLNDNGNNSNDLHNKTKQVKGSMDINGFQVLPSQAETVKRIFEKHPDMALEFRVKNHHLRTACMNVLLSLIETLCQSPQELSEEDLVEADNALAYVKDAGFKVDWLEKKLEEVKEKKEEEQNGETQIQELEFELRDFKQKCSDIEAQLEKKKAKVLAARASLTLDDFV